MFESPFQLKLYGEIEEIFIEGTFRVAPKEWYQLLNIYGYIKKIIFIFL